MSYLQYITSRTETLEIPGRLPDPLNPAPHPLARLASKYLRAKLDQTPLLSQQLHRDGCGKMFGVLVVREPSGRVGYLSSFSGMLNRQWIVPGFVPPVFDADEQAAFLREGEVRLLEFSRLIENHLLNPARLGAVELLADLKRKCEREISTLRLLNQENKKLRRSRRQCISNDADQAGVLQELSLASQKDKKAYKQLKAVWREKLQQAQQQLDEDFEDEISQLKTSRRQLSQQLHDRVFETYRLQNNVGEVASIKSLFDDKTPPGGTGDCAAPKMFQYAFQNNLQPLALAEFWYGGSPTDGIRHHGYYYPPCRGKCQPILPFMLKGLDIDVVEEISTDMELQPEIVFEDADILVLNKPIGLLSIPGKTQSHSVASWVADRYPDASGPLIVHRLDMATSGLLLVAKKSYAHKALQKQFITRGVEKRYVAILSRPVEADVKTIDLPLRVDLDDRPRQMVCFEHGKKAKTRFEVISRDHQSSRVYFYPLTGRTHQLRVHAAHSKGLGAPIVGDALYGVAADRMMLHAERLSFDHPGTGERMTVEVEAPF